MVVEKGDIKAWFICSLALVQCIAVLDQVNAGTRSICEQIEMLNIRSLGDLKELTADGCSPDDERALNAVIDMTRDSTKTEFGEPVELCTIDRALKITRFIKTFVKTPQELGYTVKIPKALVDFVVAYGMHVSSQCKWYPYRRFAHERPFKEYANAMDVGGGLEILTDGDSRIGHLLDPIIKPLEFLLPSQFEKMFPGFLRHHLRPELYSHINQATLPSVRKLCKDLIGSSNNFYLSAIAHLANNGFDHYDSMLELRLSPAETKQSTTSLSKAVFLCKAIKQLDHDLMEPGKDPRISDDDISDMPNQEPKYLERLDLSIPVNENLFAAEGLRNAVDSFDPMKSPEERFSKKLSDRNFHDNFYDKRFPFGSVLGNDRRESSFGGGSKRNGIKTMIVVPKQSHVGAFTSSKMKPVNPLRQLMDKVTSCFTC